MAIVGGTCHQNKAYNKHYLYLMVITSLLQSTQWDNKHYKTLSPQTPWIQTLFHDKINRQMLNILRTVKRLVENLLGASSIGVMHGPSCSEKCAKNTMIFMNADLTSVLGQPNRYSQNLHRNNCNM